MVVLLCSGCSFQESAYRVDTVVWIPVNPTEAPTELAETAGAKENTEATKATEPTQGTEATEAPKKTTNKNNSTGKKPSTNKNNSTGKTEKPKETEPPRTEPVETRPPATGLPETAPVVTEPPVTEPEATKVPDTQPPETAPAVTKPLNTQPPETVPLETESSDTRPSETVPAVTEPPAAQPEETKPEATEPPQTEPETPLYDISGYSVGSLGYGICDEINALRVGEGLTEISLNARLSAIASCRGYELSQVWSHTRPDGRGYYTVLGDYGYGAGAVTELLVYVSGSGDAASVVAKWAGSDSHLASMLSESYSTIGVGTYQADGLTYICVLLAG